MFTNLFDYVKIFEKSLSDEICNKVTQEFESLSWSEHEFYYPDGSFSSRSGEKELSVSWQETKVFNELMQNNWNCVDSYVKTLSFPWYSQWSGISPIRYNRYEKNKLMALHCDHISSLFDGERKGIPTLSIVTVFNAEYSGGDFIMFDDTKINLSKGDTLIFPSNFLYPHRINEVISGTRYSYASWVW